MQKSLKSKIRSLKAPKNINTRRDFFWDYRSRSPCHFYLIPRGVLESLRQKTACDGQLASVAGVWVSRWHQVFEAGWLWAGHCGGRPLIHRLRYTNLRGPRNHCGNRVRRLWFGVVLSLQRGKVALLLLLCIVWLRGRWGEGETMGLHYNFDLRNLTLCFCVQEPWAWTLIPQLVLGMWQ